MGVAYRAEVLPDALREGNAELEQLAPDARRPRDSSPLPYRGSARSYRRILGAARQTWFSIARRAGTRGDASGGSSEVGRSRYSGATREEAHGDEESNAVEPCEPWTSWLSTEEDDLVAEDCVLEDQITARAEGVGERSNHFR